MSDSGKKTDSTQKTVLLVGGSLIIALNLLLTFKNSSSTKSADKTAVASSAARENPSLMWYEKQFCRGYQESTSCSHRFLHPLVPEFEAQGKKVPSGGAPKKNKVIAEKVTVSRGTTFSQRKIVIE